MDRAQESLASRFERELRDVLQPFPGAAEAAELQIRGEDAEVELAPDEAVTLDVQALFLLVRHVMILAGEVDRLRAELDARSARS